MSKEFPQPEDAYGLTDREQLFDRVSHKRLEALLADEQTSVHEVKLDTNNFGEFLFISTSRAAGEQRVYITFYGAGFHEYRERWITGEWFWYRANPLSKEEEQTLPKDEVQALIRERQEEIAAYAGQDTQSKRGKLFEMLADLLDEDGAVSELEDMPPDWLDFLGDSLE